MADSVATLFVEVNADDIKRAVKSLSDLERQSKKNDRQNKKSAKSNKVLSGTFKELKSQMSGLNAAIAALSVGAGLTASVKAFAELDKGLIGIRKTTGLAGAELAGLGEDIQSISSQLPIATGELLAIAQAAGQLGVSGREDILAFTKTVGMLGTASDLAGEEAATSLARILNVTGEAAGDVDILGSVIVALGNNMATTEKEIASMATEIAQATGIFGVSSAEAAALGAAMRSLGIRAELGGSTVGRAFRTIETSLDAGGARLQRLINITGMTEDQLRKTFKENSVAVFQAFADGLGRAIASGQSASEVLGAFGLKGEEVLKTLPVLASRSDELARALGIANKETKNATALTEEALAAAESFSAQLEIVGNIANSAAADIGRELAPAILDVVRDFGEWTKANREFLKDDVGGAIRQISGDIKAAFDAVNALPDFVVGTGGAGLVGLALFGPYGAAFLALITATGEAVKGLQNAVNIDTSGELGWTERFSLWVADLENGTNLLEEIDSRANSIKVPKDLLLITPPKKEKAETKTDPVSKQIAEQIDLVVEKSKTEKEARKFAKKQIRENAIEQSRALIERKAELDDYLKYIEDLNQREEDSRTDAIKGMQDAIRAYQNNAEDAASATERAFSQAFKGAEDSITEFVKTGKLEFGSLIDSILEDLIRTQISQPIVSGISGAISGLDLGSLFEFANGGAFDKGVQMFATGGIVNSPTPFGMAGGGMGVAGEAGPEAILPLERKGGKLGVSATAANVNVYVQNAPENTKVERSPNAAGGEDITVIIGEIVDTQLSSGRYDNTLQRKFNIGRVGY